MKKSAALLAAALVWTLGPLAAEAATYSENPRVSVKQINPKCGPTGATRYRLVVTNGTKRGRAFPVTEQVNVPGHDGITWSEAWVPAERKRLVTFRVERTKQVVLTHRGEILFSGRFRDLCL